MAAHTRKAALEGSPGTVTSLACRVVGPSTEAVRLPAVVVAPNSGSMSSVWLRDAEGSLTVVVPTAPRPASKIAVFNWADAIGASYSIALR